MARRLADQPAVCVVDIGVSVAALPSKNVGDSMYAYRDRSLAKRGGGWWDGTFAHAHRVLFGPDSCPRFLNVNIISEL